ncbi:MAG: DUF2283 domain-containing protein [Actinobacteria bacterium]|nr:DUF2283 domain-containing protein [Actinomycetota bacterium]
MRKERALRIELDKEYDLLYIELHTGDIERTEDLADGVHLDLDAEDQVVGVEFLSLDAFDAFVEDNNLPANPIEWLRFQTDLRQMLLGPHS